MMPQLVQPPDELVRFWHEKYEQDLRERSHKIASVISTGGGYTCIT
jgi:hypothetical protein